MNADSNDVDDTSPKYKALEEGSTTQSKEELVEMANRQNKFIQGLEAALVRIKNKTYGIDIYEARKKLDYQILWYPENADVDYSVTEEFLMKFTQNRKFMLESVYSYAMELEEKNYHDMMMIYLIISVLVDILAYY